MTPPRNPDPDLGLDLAVDAAHALDVDLDLDLAVDLGRTLDRGHAVDFGPDLARTLPVDLDLEALVRLAMGLADEAGRRGDPPFGAVLVDAAGAVVARSANAQVSGGDPTAHAEVELLRAAARDGMRPPLDRRAVVVNAEPCSMCASALIKAGIGAIVYGAPHEPHMDPDLPLADVVARSRRPPLVIGGVLADLAAAQIAGFREGASAPD